MSKTVQSRAKERDGHTCQKCEHQLPKHRLEAHHIHPQWAGGEDVLDNLVTLCKTCHSFAPEVRSEERAHDITEAYLARSVPPALDLFLLGVEWNCLTDSGLDDHDDGMEKIVDMLGSEGGIDPDGLMEPSDWWRALFSVVEGERVLNAPERIQSDMLRDYID